jgi:hypothetical protein
MLHCHSVNPLTMRQQRLYDVVRHFMCDSDHATLVVAAQCRFQTDVEASLVFFLSDFTSARYTTALYSTKNAYQVAAAAHRLENQITEYTLELQTHGARQYVQDRVQIAEPPQRANPDFETVRYRLLFRERDNPGLETPAYPFVVYDHLNLTEFRLLLAQRDDAAKRILVLYVSDLAGPASTGNEPNRQVDEACNRAFYDPTVHYYEMHDTGGGGRVNV